MRRALLDVNVLLALLDSDHVDPDRARDWLDTVIVGGWASCAITQNGFVRILSQPRYPSPVSPATAIALLSRACESEHHAFLLCEVSLLSRWHTTRASSPSTGRCPSPRCTELPKTTCWSCSASALQPRPTRAAVRTRSESR